MDGHRQRSEVEPGATRAEDPRGSIATFVWSLWALICTVAVITLVFSVLNRDRTEGLDLTPFIDAAGVCIAIAFTTVGALVAIRRPRNPTGWILLCAALMADLSGITESYGVYALFTNPGALPGGAMAAWVSTWAYIPVPFLAPGLVFLLFPSGRLPSRRWRIVVWIMALATLATAIDAALSPVFDDEPFKGVANPLPIQLPRSVLTQLGNIGWPGMTLGLILAGVGMIFRLRRSTGDERQQLKWLATAAALLPPIIAVGVAAYYLGQQDLGYLLVNVGWEVILFAAGVAILRHRLYDIDVIINRTVVYAALSVVLALIYAAGVVGVGGLLRGAAGGETNSLAVAASTLVVAALFRPARARIQSFIDRRFYRRKYDATRTVAAFGSRLRDEVELDAMTGDLLAVAKETMQPSHVSMWLRRPT